MSHHRVCECCGGLPSCVGQNITGMSVSAVSFTGAHSEASTNELTQAYSSGDNPSSCSVMPPFTGCSDSRVVFFQPGISGSGYEQGACPGTVLRSLSLSNTVPSLLNSGSDTIPTAFDPNNTSYPSATEGVGAVEVTATRSMPQTRNDSDDRFCQSCSDTVSATNSRFYGWSVFIIWHRDAWTFTASTARTLKAAVGSTSGLGELTIGTTGDGYNDTITGSVAMPALSYEIQIEAEVDNNHTVDVGLYDAGISGRLTLRIGMTSDGEYTYGAYLPTGTVASEFDNSDPANNIPTDTLERLAKTAAISVSITDILIRPGSCLKGFTFDVSGSATTPVEHNYEETNLSWSCGLGPDFSGVQSVTQVYESTASWSASLSGVVEVDFDDGL